MQEWTFGCLGNAYGSAEPEGTGCVVLHSAKGKLSDSQDSFLFYYTKIDPRTENFELSARFTVTEVSDRVGWQAGYGILAADTVASGDRDCRARNMVSVGRHRTDRFDEYSFGLRAVAGYRDPEARENGPARILDASRIFSAGPETHNGSDRAPKLRVGESCLLTLRKTDDGIEAEYAGETLFLKGSDFLAVQEEDAVYIGFAAAGALTVRVDEIRCGVGPGKLSTMPEDAFRVTIPDYPFSRELLAGRPAKEGGPAGGNGTAADSGMALIVKKQYSGTIRVSPESVSDLQTALRMAAGSTEIVLADGVYAPEDAFVVPARDAEDPERNSISGEMIRIRAEHPGRAVLDGSRMKKRMPVMIVNGDCWHLQGLVFRGSPSAGLLVAGNGNRIERCEAYENRDTGILICRLPGAPEERRPSGNTVLRCDSCGNRDDAGVNADGFGAKLSVGEGNRFIECIARENADDGFDLYSKSILGPIGAVMIDRCVACGNGGMGFKLGGEDQQAAHEVRDCLAYANAGGGFSANSNQALRLSGLISWKNGPGPARDNYRLGKPGGGNEQKPERTGLLPEGSSEKAEQEFLRKVARPDITVVPGRREDGSIDLHGAFERRKRSVMFLAPRVSGGGAEKMITTLASCLADDYDVTLVTLLKANGQETYFVSEKVRRICLADRPAFSDGGGNSSRASAVPWWRKMIRALEKRIGRKPASPAQIVPEAAKEAERERKYGVQIERLKKLKRSLSPDCSISFLNSANYVNALSHTGERTVISVRSYPEGPFAPEDCRTEEGRARIREACEKADVIVPVACETAECLMRSFGAEEEKIRVIRNSIDPAEVRRSAERAPEGPETGNMPGRAASGLLSAMRKASVVFCSSGRLTEKKGHWHILRAFREVRKKVPGALLVILGREGKHQANTAGLLRSIISECGLEGSVLLPGFLEDPYPILAQADIYVSASYNEGFPNALLEAMALGLPVISTDCRSGPREILAPGSDPSVKTAKIEYARFGVLLPVCSGERRTAEPLEPAEEMMAEAMLSLANDRSLRERYAAASAERAEQFGREEILRQWKALIEDE